MLVGLDLPSVGRGIETGPIPTSGQVSESEKKHLRLKVKQLICGSLNGKRIRQSLMESLLSIHTLDRDTGPLEGTAAAAAKSLQSCPTLCDPTDGSPPGSSIPGILQARILERVAISLSNACMLSRFSRVQLCAAPWTAAHQAPPSTGFSKQEYWSGLTFPSPLEGAAAE